MSKQFWIIIAVIILAVGGVVVFNNHKNNDSSSTSSASVTNHLRGGGTSGVTLLDYGDFQCSACESYYPVIEAVYSKYSDQITFQFRNFPLTSLHPNAFAAARAAEAADQQGKFWDMYTMLYTSSNWSAWIDASNPQSFFQQYASSIGLDVNKFNQDFSSSKINDIVRADLAAATALKLTGTPTYFLDGKLVANPPQDVDGWSKLIDSAIASKQSAQ